MHQIIDLISKPHFLPIRPTDHLVPTPRGLEHTLSILFLRHAAPIILGLFVACPWCALGLRKVELNLVKLLGTRPSPWLVFCIQPPLPLNAFPLQLRPLVPVLAAPRPLKPNLELQYCTSYLPIVGTAWGMTHGNRPRSFVRRNPDNVCPSLPEKLSYRTYCTL